MIKNIFFPLIHLFLILCLIYFISSCASSNHNRRGSLSEAMDKASDESEDSEVETEPDPDYDYDEEEEYMILSLSEDSLAQHYQNLEDEQPQTEIINTDFENSPIWLSIRGGTGIIKGKDYFGLNHFNLALGADFMPQHRFEFNAGFAWAPLQQTSTLKHSLDG